MPPKIVVMPKHLTLLLHGDDQINDESSAQAGNGLPHELFLLGRSFPLAAALADQQFNSGDMLICIEPIHLHATRDHLVLLGLDPFKVLQADLEVLMNEASAIFIEEGLGPLIQVAPFQWLGKTDVFNSLHTHSTAQAQGRNIDWWLPQDNGELGLAKRWRKIQNEVQMRWHIHPLNQAREEQGLPRINSIWISGIGRKMDLQLAPELISAQMIISDQAWMARLAHEQGITSAHDSLVSWESLPENTLICHSNAKLIWPVLCQMLIEHDLVLEVIDFPKSVRKRRFKSSDFHSHLLLFWRKLNPPQWEDLIA